MTRLPLHSQPLEHAFKKKSQFMFFPDPFSLPATELEMFITKCQHHAVCLPCGKEDPRHWCGSLDVIGPICSKEAVLLGGVALLEWSC